jgi:glycosyltransferase involved in cell wall biosynthesis
MPGALISIVIPCFNQGHCVANAVQSAVSHSCRTEVIVVDDGSTDGTQAAVACSASARYIRQPNRGLAAARNRGLEFATGDFVVFLDADDELMPGGLAAGVRALAAHPECALAYGRCVMMEPDGTVWLTPHQRRVVSGHHAVLLRTNPIWMPAMAIFRRAPLVASGGFASDSRSRRGRRRLPAARDVDERKRRPNAARYARGHALPPARRR